MEDFGGNGGIKKPNMAMSYKRKRGHSGVGSEPSQAAVDQDAELTKSWRELLGPPPPMGTTKVKRIYSKIMKKNLVSWVVYNQMYK